MQKKTVLIAQLIISGMMAAMMSAAMAYINLGTLHAVMAVWPRSFAIAWPIAFLLSLIVGPLAFKAAAAITRVLEGDSGKERKSVPAPR